MKIKIILSVFLIAVTGIFFLPDNCDAQRMRGGNKSGVSRSGNSGRTINGRGNNNSGTNRTYKNKTNSNIKKNNVDREKISNNKGTKDRERVNDREGVRDNDGNKDRGDRQENRDERQGDRQENQAPEGAEIKELPSGYTTTIAGNMKYYYHGGVFYMPTETGYKVVSAPIGAIVYKLPEGGEELDLQGNKLIKFNGAYYQPIMHDGEDAYEVVKYKG